MSFGSHVTLRRISITSGPQNMDTATFRKAAHAAIDESKDNLPDPEIAASILTGSHSYELL